MGRTNDMAKMLTEWEFLPSIKAGPETVRSVKKFIDQVSKQISGVVGKLAKVGYSDKDLERITKKMRDIRNEIAKARAEGNKEQEAAIQEKFDKEKKNLEDIVSRRKQASRDLDKGALIGAEKPAALAAKVGEEMGQSLNDVLSGELGGVGGMFKRWGDMTKKGGLALQAKQTDKTAGSIKGKLGGIIGQLGGIIAAVGAIAMAFAGVVKVMIDADTKTKELNRTLIDSGAMAGDITSNVHALEGAFDRISKMAQQSEFNKVWDTLAEDQVKILGAFSGAGFTLKEMRTQIKGAKTEMQAYQQATSAALTYSKLLGESADKPATDMADRMEDMGLSLRGVREGFANIYEAAQMSGFGTKRFFNMVLQATSGLSMYNVRLEEAAGMMLNLSKVLGSRVGDQFFQSLTKGFSDLSQEDRIKKVMLLGPEEFGKILTKQIAATSREWAQKASDIFGKDFKKGSEALAALGIDMGVSQDLLRTIGRGGPAAQKARESLAKQVADQLQQMNPGQIATAIADMRKAGADPKLIRELEDLIDLTRGMSGDINEQAAALAVMGPGGKLAADFAVAARWTGKELAKSQKIDWKILQDQMGWNNEQTRQYIRIARERQSSFGDMQKELAALQASGKKVTKEQNKVFAKAFGMAIKGDKIFHATMDKGNVRLGGEIKDVTDAIMAQGSALANMPEKLTKQEEFAKKIAENTLTIGKRIQQHVEEFLRDIRDAVVDIKVWLTGGANTDERQARNEAAKQFDRNAKKLAARKAAAKTPEERAAIERQEKMSKTLAKIARKDEAGGTISDYKTDDYIKRAAETVLDVVAAPRTVRVPGIGPRGRAHGIPREYEEAVSPAKLGQIKMILSGMFDKKSVAKISGEVEAEFKKKLEQDLERAADRLQARGATKEQAEAEDARIRRQNEADRRREEAKRLAKMLGEEEKKLLKKISEGVLETSSSERGQRAKEFIDSMRSEAAKTPPAGSKDKPPIGHLSFEFHGAAPAQQKAAEETIRTVAPQMVS